MSSFIAALGLVSALHALGPPHDATNEGDPSAGEVMFWRGVMNCGPNCLYLLLKSHGREVAYDDLVSAMSLGPKGTSLLQLRDAALTTGHDVSLYKGTTDDLASLELPVILHLDRESGEIEGLGHFVLLASYNDHVQEATVFDGTTGSSMALSFEALRGMWSGYLLCLDETPAVWSFLTAMGATTLICLGAAKCIRKLRPQ